MHGFRVVIAKVGGAPPPPGWHRANTGEREKKTNSLFVTKQRNCGLDRAAVVQREQELELESIQ